MIYNHDVGTFGNVYCRFTILYAGLIVCIATMPLWLAYIIPDYISTVNGVVLLTFSCAWLSIAYNAIFNFRSLQSGPIPTVESVSASRKRQFRHVVIVPCYLDPIDVLFDCLGTLMMQENGENLLVVVAFELKTPDVLLKQATVQDAFHDKFGHLLITTHEVLRDKEIPGGCSNKNYALHQAYSYLQTNDLIENTSITLTTCDTDTLFHPMYFKTLEAVYNRDNPILGLKPRMCVYQPPLFYNWDLDQRPFFNRITGIMRSMMMLGGLISFNLNPMSLFSYPLELGLLAGFINPRYGVDDIIAKVRWMCATNESVPVILLPVPCISGPTIGTTFMEEVTEWSRQIRRWIVGSSESFHYFVIHFRGEPMFAGVIWFICFFSYYAVLLCCAGIFGILAGIPLPGVAYPSIDCLGVSISLRHASLGALVLQYIAFGIGFYIDRQAIQIMRIKEDISFMRNFCHWLLAPVTLLVYSLIAFKAIVKFVFVGKKMARHDMAAKAGLIAGTALEETEGGGDELDVSLLSNSKNNVSETDDGVTIDRSRSTSISKEHCKPDVNLHNRKSHLAIDKDTKLTKNGFLCSLPSKFYFGDYALCTSEYPKVEPFVKNTV